MVLHGCNNDHVFLFHDSLSCLGIIFFLGKQTIGGFLIFCSSFHASTATILHLEASVKTVKG